MTTLATYSFTRADVNPIPNPPWENPSGSLALKVVSNAAVVTFAGNDCWGVHTQGGVTWPADQWSEIIPSAVGGKDFGPVVHGSVGTWNGYMMTDFDTTNAYIYEIDAGSFTQVASGTGGYSGTQPLYIESKVSGANKIIKGFINGVEKVSYTDTSPRATGSPGLFHFDGTSSTASWQGGDFNTPAANSFPPVRSTMTRLAPFRHF